MSEISISREEAINVIKTALEYSEKALIKLDSSEKWHKEMENFGEYYSVRENVEKEITASKKAISDMEKLEKIEKLYEPKPFGQGLSREDRDREIEQIVKGK